MILKYEVIAREFLYENKEAVAKIGEQHARILLFKAAFRFAPTLNLVQASTQSEHKQLAAYAKMRHDVMTDTGDSGKKHQELLVSANRHAIRLIDLGLEEAYRVILGENK